MMYCPAGLSLLECAEFAAEKSHLLSSTSLGGHISQSSAHAHAETTETFILWSCPGTAWLISQPDDLSDIDIRISMSIFDSQMTEKCSTEISLHAKLRYDTKKELLFPICEKKYFCCFCRKFQTNKIIHGSKNSCPGIMT